MEHPFLKQFFEKGVRHHRAGRLSEAEAAYKQILSINPEDSGSLHGLGCLRYQAGEFQSAIDLIRKALSFDPRMAAAYCNLGAALKQQGRLSEAAESYRRALDVDPKLIQAHNNLGAILGRLGRQEDAAESYRHALALDPSRAEVHNNLGAALEKLGRLQEAADHCRRALELKPDFAEAYSNLGLALTGLGRLKQAVALLRRALTLKPDFAEAYNNLALVLRKQGHLDEAAESFYRALALKPDLVEAHNGLGSVLEDQGLPKEAANRYRHALALQPEFSAAHTNLIFALNFDLEAGPEQQWQERVRWYEQHARRFAPTTARHTNSPEPQRRLKVGYVGGHFRHGAATYAFAPMLLNHDAEHFEVVCYSDTVQADDLTQAFRASVEHWRDINGWSDDRVAETIRADGIDILVDLVGHMRGNRLLVFARKPAPIQVTGWGEPTGTGLAMMDYLLADPVLVPPACRRFLTEQVVDLPGFLGYWTPDLLPEPGPLPALAKGYVTFGSFNRMPKISDTVLRCWASILRALPGSRLILKNPWLDVPSQQVRVRTALAAEGIVSERLTLLGHSDRYAHFTAYNLLDIGLDPFPHGGGMTTLDALWMGVPVVTALGATISSRLAAASLVALGLSDFVAPDRTAYVGLAVAKGTDLGALARLRRELRSRVAGSAIGDPGKYARAVEAAYRAIWRRWCKAQVSAQT